LSRTTQLAPRRPTSLVSALSSVYACERQAGQRDEGSPMSGINAPDLFVINLEHAQREANAAPCPGCGLQGTRRALEVTNSGPNQGRLFIKCRACGRFDWFGPAPAPTDAEVAELQARATPCPGCGQPRRAFRVRKEGANQGRLFLLCAARGCERFEWASPAKPGTDRPAIDRPVTEEGLLSDIRECDEDGPRLIYADWLEDHGRSARAELIRVQCALARGEGNEELRRREQQLLAEHGQEWAAAGAGHVKAWDFRRGLLEQVTLTAEAFAKSGEEMLCAVPLRALTVEVDGWADVRTLVRCRALAKIAELTLAGGPVYAAGARILAEAP